LAFGTLKNQEFLIVENYFITAKTLKKTSCTATIITLVSSNVFKKKDETLNVKYNFI
jgi:hypothetical protein